MHPTKLAITYTVSSVFIGPLVFLLGYSFTRGGGDYCDLLYYLPDGSVDPAREVEFRNAQIFQVAGASIMLLLGSFILIYLFRNNRDREKSGIWVALVVVLMMAGYVAVILSSGTGGQIC